MVVVAVVVVVAVAVAVVVVASPSERRTAHGSTTSQHKTSCGRWVGVCCVFTSPVLGQDRQDRQDIGGEVYKFCVPGLERYLVNLEKMFLFRKKNDSEPSVCVCVRSGSIAQAVLSAIREHFILSSIVRFEPWRSAERAHEAAFNAVFDAV